MNSVFKSSPFPTAVPQVIPARLQSPTRRPLRGRQESLPSRLGVRIRTARVALSMTGEVLAQASGVSRSLLSRIERGLVSPSVDTLERLAEGLGMPVARLFAESADRAEVSLVRRGQGMLVATPGADAGAHCSLLGHLPASSAQVEPYLVQLDQATTTLVNDKYLGLQFLYLLSGRMRYRCGLQIYELCAGDSLTFQATAPHGVESVEERPVSYLLVVCRGKSE